MSRPNGNSEGHLKIGTVHARKIHTVSDAVAVGCEIESCVIDTVESTVFEKSTLAEMTTATPGINNTLKIIALAVAARAHGLKRLEYEGSEGRY